MALGSAGGSPGSSYRVTLYIDIETRSRADLRKVGVYKYSEDTDFSILMAAWAIDDGPITVAVGEDEIRAIPGLFHHETPKVAHNAMFERVCLSTLVAGYLSPEPWVDTAALAAEYGRPVSLKDCAKALGAAPKDEAGSSLIRLFCMPNREGGWNDKTTHPMDWLDFISYCEQDVDTLREIHRSLGDWPAPMEHRVWCADQRINDRGMLIDRELCQAAALAAEENLDINAAEFTRLTDVTNPRSVQQVMAWAKTVDLDLPNLQAETIEGFLADPDLPELHRQVLEIRQDLSGVATGKFGAALAVVSPDDRIRGGFKFFGAHTGRWTGQRVQPQNLPRHALDSEAEVEAAILDLKMGLGADPPTLKALVRAMFSGPLTVVDYSAIEARVVAWLAGEEWALQAFRDGRDIYVETAQRMGGLTRFQGKVAVLALGYNGGVNSLRNMGAEGDDEALQVLVNVWRQANPKIVRLWAQMQDAVAEGGRVGPHLRVVRRGSKMEMRLPSGRSIWYHDLREETYRVVDPKTKKSLPKQGWRYSDPKRSGQRIGTYGGRLVENATQAVARDVLAEALVRLYEAGFKVSGHVHDEVIVETTLLDEVTKIVTAAPTWATGLPIDGEGFVAERYRKG
jgi:DNA polymerase